MSEQPDNSKVICPNCCHEFGAMSVDDQTHRRHLEAWAHELHRQLEKLWYTPKGFSYSQDEQDDVCAVLGPTDDAMPSNFDRAEYWYERHGLAHTASAPQSGAPERQGK